MAIRFEDGFETEAASFTTHWSGLQQKASGRITLVASPVANETKAARFECRVGDNNVAGSGTGERAETLKSGSAIGGGYGTEGQTEYTAFSIRFESGFPYPTSSLWNYVAQWHASAGGTQASALAVVNGTIVLITNGGTSLSDKPFNRVVVDETFETGKWYDFVIKHHWSSTSGGYFDIWFQKDGAVTGPFTVNGPNRYATDTGSMYPKIGVYRAAGLASSAILEYGRYRICDSFAEATAAFDSWGSVTPPGTPDPGAGFTEPDTTDPLSGGGVRVGVAFNDVALEASPSWTYLTDTDNLVASYTIDRGRQFEFDRTDAGTATVTLNDTEGVLDPTNSSGPYYGLLEPLLQIKIDLWNPVLSEWRTRFRGWIEDFTYLVEPFTHQDANGDTVGVTRLEISCVDIFEILTAIEMQANSFGDTPPPAALGNIFFDNNDGQGRIDQVLGNAGIPTDFYVAFTLNIDMQESTYSPGQNVLEVVQDVADAEFPTVANVYTDRHGRLAVHGRLAKFDPATVAAGASAGAWDFTQWKAGDGKAVHASSTDTAHIRTFSYNRGLSMIRNSAYCTPTGIRPSDIAGQYSTDSTSIGKYGIRSWSAENLLIEDGTLTGNTANEECAAFAHFITTNYAQPRNRITEITFKSIDPAAEGAGANWDMLCRADISDTVDVTIRGPGDDDTSYIFNAETFFIEGIHEEAVPAAGAYAMVTLSLDLSPQAYFTDGTGVTS